MKKQAQKTSRRSISELWVVRSFVPLFRRSTVYFYRIFVHSPSLPSVALRLPVGKFFFFLTFPVLHFPMFALHARLVDIWVGREGRLAFLCARAVAVFLPFFSYFFLHPLLSSSSFASDSCCV